MWSSIFQIALDIIGSYSHIAASIAPSDRDVGRLEMGTQVGVEVVEMDRK